MKDYYKILQSKPEDDVEDIKKKYRKLAKEWHPDLHPNDPEAEEAFSDLAEAWAVLSDENKRDLYDRGLYNPEADLDNITFTDEEMDLLQLFQHHIGKEMYAEEVDQQGICDSIRCDINAASDEFKRKKRNLETKQRLIKAWLNRGIFHKKVATDHNLLLMSLMTADQACTVEIQNLTEEIEKSRKLLILLDDFIKQQFSQIGSRFERSISKGPDLLMGPPGHLKRASESYWQPGDSIKE